MGNCLDSCLPEPITPDDRRIVRPMPQLQSATPRSRLQEERNNDHIRFFMTGLGSAGKTTLVRQLFLLSNRVSNYKLCNENWQEERTKPDDNFLWVATIRKNVLDSMEIFIKVRAVFLRFLAFAPTFCSS